MDIAFIKVLNMSISASWLVLAVLVLRFLLKKSPRWVHVALWGLVAVRLLCPVSIESGVSLIPGEVNRQIVEKATNGYHGDASIYSQGSPEFDLAVQSGVEVMVGDNNYQYVITEQNDPTRPVETVTVLLRKIWGVGMLVMLLHALVSYGRLRKKVAASVEQAPGVYLCDYIDTPFILGVFRPRIYLPSAMEPDAAEYVLAHERAHIARKDHWWKPLGYVLLTVHWFNPLLWLAYVLLCRDIELACDERVVQKMEIKERKTYSETLLQCSVSRRNLAACPLAFGEVGVKQRIQSVLNYKKPGFLMVVIAVVCLILAAVCFLTDPVELPDAPFGCNYQVEKVIYQNPVLSFYMTEDNAPLFRITEEGNLEVQREPRRWESCGVLEEIEITLENFDNCFFAEELGWQGGPSAKQLRWDTEKAWRISYELAGLKRVYYLLKLQNGDIYLADGAEHTDTVNFSWCFRLTDSGRGWEENEETPFGFYYRQNGIIYSDSDVESTYLFPYDLYALTAGHSMTQMRNMEDQGDHLARFAPVELTEENFVTCFRDRDFGAALLKENASVWEGRSFGPNPEQEHIWYLMQQKGGQVYLATSVLEGGSQQVGRIYRLHRVISDDPHTPSTDPLQWMLNIQYQLGYPNPQVTAESQGHQVELSDWEFNGLTSLLQDINPEQMAVGTLKGEPEVTIRIQPEAENGFPAELYWNEEEMVLLLDTGSWNIIDPELEEYLSSYAYGPRETSPLNAPEDAYFWCQNMSRKYLNSYCLAQQDVQIDEYHVQAFARELSAEEIDQLFIILKNIPKAGFQKSEPVYTDRSVQISCRDVWNEESAYGYAQLSLVEDGVFYTYIPNEGDPYQTWKLESDELENFLEKILAEDTSGWSGYAPQLATEGEISAQAGPVWVTIPKIAGFEYQTTSEGIRFHPENSEYEGWISITWQEEWEVQAGNNLHTANGVMGARPTLWAYFPNSNVWSSICITLESGGYLVIYNESDQDWVETCLDGFGHLLVELEIEEQTIYG